MPQFVGISLDSFTKPGRTTQDVNMEIVDVDLLVKRQKILRELGRRGSRMAAHRKWSRLAHKIKKAVIDWVVDHEAAILRQVAAGRRELVRGNEDIPRQIGDFRDSIEPMVIEDCAPPHFRCEKREVARGHRRKIVPEQTI